MSEQDELEFELASILSRIGASKFSKVDYTQEAKSLLAKVKSEYPIMYREYADEVGDFIRRGWIPPEEAKEHYVKWDREKVAKQIYWWKCKGVAVDFIVWDKLSERTKEWYRKDADQLHKILTRRLK